MTTNLCFSGSCLRIYSKRPQLCVCWNKVSRDVTLCTCMCAYVRTRVHVSCSSCRRSVPVVALMMEAKLQVQMVAGDRWQKRPQVWGLSLPADFSISISIKIKLNLKTPREKENTSRCPKTKTEHNQVYWEEEKWAFSERSLWMIWDRAVKSSRTAAKIN